MKTSPGKYGKKQITVNIHRFIRADKTARQERTKVPFLASNFFCSQVVHHLFMNTTSVSMFFCPMVVHHHCNRITINEEPRFVDKDVCSSAHPGGRGLSPVWHGRMQMQRSIKPLFRCEPASFCLNLDKPITLIGDPDMNVCFSVHLGVMAINEVVQQPLLVSGDRNRRQPFIYHTLFDGAPLRQFLPGHTRFPQKYSDLGLEVIHACIFRIQETLARFFLGIFVHKKYLLTFVSDERKNVFAIQ